MTKEELYRNSMFNENIRIQLLENNYSDYICLTCNRLIGFSNQILINQIICRTNKRMEKISMDCDISSLVFDSIRKEVLELLRKDEELHQTINHKLLQKTDIFTNISECDVLRVDIVLTLMLPKQREYFIKRYYYLDDTIDYNIKHEKKISGLFNGKVLQNTDLNFTKYQKQV